MYFIVIITIYCNYGSRPVYLTQNTLFVAAADTECAANNGTGDCSHICATTYNGHVCQCHDGYELAADHRTCQGS